MQPSNTWEFTSPHPYWGVSQQGSSGCGCSCQCRLCHSCRESGTPRWPVSPSAEHPSPWSTLSGGSGWTWKPPSCQTSAPRTNFHFRPEEDQSIWSKRRQGSKPCYSKPVTREPSISCPNRLRSSHFTGTSLFMPPWKVILSDILPWSLVLYGYHLYASYYYTTVQVAIYVHAVYFMCQCYILGKRPPGQVADGNHHRCW